MGVGPGQGPEVTAVRQWEAFPGSSGFSWHLDEGLQSGEREAGDIHTDLKGQGAKSTHISSVGSSWASRSWGARWSLERNKYTGDRKEVSGPCRPMNGGGQARRAAGGVWGGRQPGGNSVQGAVGPVQQAAGMDGGVTSRWGRNLSGSHLINGVPLTIGPTSPVSPFSPEGPGKPCTGG